MSLLVGASGFSFTSWKPGFYPAGMRSADFLSFYAERLSTVELNGTFYRQPEAATFERWAASVPDGFRFAVKAPRTISIFGRVDFAPEFCDRMRSLGWAPQHDAVSALRELVAGMRDGVGELTPPLRPGTRRPEA